MFKQGDIVLVPFPFTDLSGNKVRPALVLSHKQTGDDVTVCFISSIIAKNVLAFELVLNEKDIGFKNTGLKIKSLVKVNKIATLDKKVILGKIGQLDTANLNKIKKILKAYFTI